MPAPRSYSKTQIFLHWAVAALVLFQLFVNEGMQHAFDDRLDGHEVSEMGGALIHVGVGLTVLALAAIRLVIRLIRGAPPAHHRNPAIINWLGQATHFLLYGFIFLMPLTGAVAWFFGVEFSAELHEIGRFVLIPAISLHILGALVEHFVFRNDSLRRMLGASAD